MRTLVTGSTGFLGSHLVERLLAQGHEVRALARRTSNLDHLRSTGVEIVFGDIEDYESLLPAVKGIEVVFHAAARVTPGWGEWHLFHASIVTGTENMLRASATAGCNRFLYVSTGGVYGRACEGDTAACESTPCHVNLRRDTYYESAKLLAEQAVFKFHERGGIEVCVIRPGAVYGPRDRLVADRVFRHVCGPIVVWPGRSDPLYSVVFASDAGDCAIAAATSDRAAGRLYNVAPAQGVRFRDFAAAMARAMGGSRIQLTVPYGLSYCVCGALEGWSKLRRVDEMPYLTRSALRFLGKGLFLDAARAREELGWEPRVSVEEGTRLYVAWRRSRSIH